tara:strand:- start:2717 stop:3346 length:630 start_codon:yes stop_codon:yes gene_type:complete
MMLQWSKIKVFLLKVIKTMLNKVDKNAVITEEGLFDKAFSHILAVEGGYVNDPLDKGGETNFGITKKVAEMHGYAGDMKLMTENIAKSIYKADYWDVIQLDAIGVISPEIALEMFDSGVNCGVRWAAKWFQRSMNLLNRNGTMFENLEVDGFLGPKSIMAFNSFKDKDHKYILKTMNLLQGMRYISICERDNKQDKFFRGWLSRVKLEE